MKKYSIILSTFFPKNHPMAGAETCFEYSTIAAIDGKINTAQKIHTIRDNYPLWEKRFEKINNGEACLSIRVWNGVPYRSKQKEIALLTKEDGIGLQKLRFYNNCLLQPMLNDGTAISVDSLAQNDGLSFENWKSWFDKNDLSKQFAIIHFTKRRY